MHFANILIKFTLTNTAKCLMRIFAHIAYSALCIVQLCGRVETVTVYNYAEYLKI